MAVVGMAVAIALGAGYFALVGSSLDATVPIEGGDRLVMMSYRYVSGPDAAPGLALVAAVLIGVLPALKATGKRVRAGLQQFSSRGAGGDVRSGPAGSGRPGAPRAGD